MFSHDGKLCAKINCAAMAVSGANRASMFTVTCLLEESGLPSVNWLVFKSAAIDAWKSQSPEASKNNYSPFYPLWWASGLQHQSGGLWIIKTSNMVPK